MKFLIMIIIVALLISPMAVRAEGTISATDSRIKYVGRWIENQKGYMEGSFECMAEIRFSGTYLKVTKGSSGKLYVSVDGGEYVEMQLDSTKSLAKNLENGEHTVKIFARAQQAFPIFAGFETDGDLLAPIERPTIEFIGDSILEGYTVDPVKNASINSYGHLVGEMLGFDRNIVAFGGITITPNYGNPDKQGMVNRYYMRKEYQPAQPTSEAWDTSLFVPDHIVINLGTNDSNAQAGEFLGSYITFLTNLRKSYPETNIFIMTPFNGRKNEEVKNVYNVAKDDKMFLIDSYLWGVSGGSDNLHPTVEGHKKAAELLAKEITEILAPKATATPEVTPQATQEDSKNNMGTYIAVGASVAVVGAGAAAVAIAKKKKDE